jgi:methylglutaconyl-CoA hydratase
MTENLCVKASELVHFSLEAGVATITLDSPYNRNALSARLRHDLFGHVCRALQDDAVRVLVLTHTGPVFCSGADLKEAREKPVAGADRLDDFADVLEALWTSAKPIVGRLAGPARAGGIGLVAVCDLAVAVDTATFAFSEVRLGVIPAVISVPLRLRIQPHALRRQFLTGETFSAQVAVESGLLTAAVPAEELDGEVSRLADMLILGAPGALAATKALLRHNAPSIAAELASMLTLSAAHFASDEGREGIRAFSEKRAPSWVPVEANRP